MRLVIIRDTAALVGQLQNPSLGHFSSVYRNAQVVVVPRATLLSAEGVAKGSNGRVWVIQSLDQHFSMDFSDLFGTSHIFWGNDLSRKSDLSDLYLTSLSWH
jgi:hypothetical protein